MAGGRVFWEVPFNGEQWRNSNSHLNMTLEEKGLYLELLTFQWMKGQLPDDPAQIAKIACVSLTDVAHLWSAAGSRVRAKFDLVPGRGWVNPEMEVIRGRKVRAATKKAQNGRLGGIAKALNRKQMLASATNLLDVCQDFASSKKLAKNGEPEVVENTDQPKNRPFSGSRVIPARDENSSLPREFLGNTKESSENTPLPPSRGNVVGLECNAEIDKVFQELEREHPRGHNPQPNLACQDFLSRFNDPASARECLRQHREKWQPVWRAGRKVPDLHNWIRAYNPKADIAVDSGPQPQTVDVAAVMARRRAARENQ